MSTEYSGRGDPQRSMELLWGVQKSPTRGPKPGISVDQIVRAAIEIADAEGLAALSMRRVAERLKVGTMSLYTYVPSKAELLDVMLDSVFGEKTQPTGVAGGWRAALELRAHDDWARYQRHPWVLQVSGARSLLGPNETDLFEATLRVVSGIGLSASEMVGVVNLVVSYVRGAAQGAVDAVLAAQRTGVSNEEWWAAREPLFDKYFDPQRYPTLVELDRAGAFEAPFEGDYLLYHAVNDFAFGLQRVLDGIEAFVQQRESRE
jgi:AcrR family transcriptional regulator